MNAGSAGNAVIAGNDPEADKREKLVLCDFALTIPFPAVTALTAFSGHSIR